MKFQKVLSEKIRKRSFWALTLLSVGILTASGFLAWGLQAQDAFATLLNTSGQQRMLSQRLAFFTSEILKEKTPKSRKKELFLMQKKALADLRKNHLFLSGTQKTLFGAMFHSATMKALYFQGDNLCLPEFFGHW